MAYIPINKGQFTLETPEREALFEKKRGFGVEEAYEENRRQWEAYPREQHVAEYPLHVDVELSSICNLKCPMCYTITDEFKEKVATKLMDYNLFTKIIDECAKGEVYSIRLSFRGEAFLHKLIIDCIRYAKKKGIYEMSSLTNCLRLEEALFKEAMKAGMDWITISFDGLGDTYEKIRKPAKYDRAIEKVANYHRIKQNAKRVKPVVKIQSVYPSIAEDPEAFYKTFAPISDMVSTNPLIDFLHGVNDIPKEEEFICPQMYQRLTIGADGLCMMCANDEEGLYIVGDVTNESIHDIWHGDKMTNARELFKKFEGVSKLPPCRKCYLPLKTTSENIVVDGHAIKLEKYLGGRENI